MIIKFTLEEAARALKERHSLPDDAWIVVGTARAVHASRVSRVPAPARQSAFPMTASLNQPAK